MASAFATYRSNPGWLRYRQLVQACFGIAIHAEPEEQRFEWEGHGVHLDVWNPPEPVPASGTVILVHGGGGHGRLLAPAGDRIAALGWRVLAADLPGYGLTQPAKGWDWDYAAWPRLVAYLADQAAADGPVVLMGFSVGGMTALGAAQLARRVDAVVATTLLDMSDPDTFDQAARWPWLGRLARLSGRVAPWLVDPVRMPLKWLTPLATLTTAPALQRTFASDPLLGGLRVPGRFFRTLHGWQPPAGDLSLPCPFLLLHPGADQWTPTAMSRTVFDRVSADKRLRELTNGSHLPLEQPAWGEMCDEIGRCLKVFARGTSRNGT